MTPSDEALRLAQTPKTDALWGKLYVVNVDTLPESSIAGQTYAHAAAQERELNALRAECERLQGEVNSALRQRNDEGRLRQAAESLAERLRAELETARRIRTAVEKAVGPLNMIRADLEGAIWPNSGMARIDAAAEKGAKG